MPHLRDFYYFYYARHAKRFIILWDRGISTIREEMHFVHWDNNEKDSQDEKRLVRMLLEHASLEQLPSA